ncbi:hypothetical protein L1987_88378 [Smallanthus sonchifolius]|nr:hypothetical protein L1987_89173 [Smallanthus sonchifolius]KAI3666521.1 hypothetical protein L1987_88962 [Smallanthus sonchifolius]KAI3666573.1 hypothetical protein L1987_88913 [Smallanthus sonchifolius]KAI3666750.1 hypothetical protein L1987_88715 [Smallanthus sonchifolius]KAI3668620.1 hypothetical protein L1987_88378 [Smallanthus sonchifolius]
MDIAGRLATIQQEIRQAENEKLQQEQRLGLFWEHPPALDPEIVGGMMQLTRDRIRGLETRIRALLAEQKELIVRAATLDSFHAHLSRVFSPNSALQAQLRQQQLEKAIPDFSPWLSLLLIDPCFLLSACVRNLPQCSVITSAKASAHSKLLKLKGNTYSTKQARHFLSAGRLVVASLDKTETFACTTRVVPALLVVTFSSVNNIPETSACDIPRCLYGNQHALGKQYSKTKAIPATQLRQATKASRRRSPGPGVPFIRLWERLSVPILHRVIKCDGQLSQSGSGQARLSSDNVVQATGSACHMKKATTMGDEGDVGLPYRCSACKAIQTTLARCSAS